MITEQVKPICAPDYKQEAHHQRMDLASRLRQSLEQSGMTASHLARAAGVVPQTIGKLLDGSNKNFSCPSVFAIAAALNVSPEWLATGRWQKDRRPQTQEHQLDPFVAAILADLAKTRTPDERQTLNATCCQSRRNGCLSDTTRRGHRRPIQPQKLRRRLNPGIRRREKTAGHAHKRN